MEVNQVQIFEKGYNNRCSTFACGNRALRYIGRPDAPLNLSYVLCEKCLNELVQSVKEQYLQIPKAPDDVEVKAVGEGVTVEMVNDARTHTEVNQLVAKYKLVNIPTKADGATLDERKQAIIDAIN